MPLRTAHAETRNLSYFPYKHTNINSVHDGMAIYFAVEDINKK
jgi:hypothetical protein